MKTLTASLLALSVASFFSACTFNGDIAQVEAYDECAREYREGYSGVGVRLAEHLERACRYGVDMGLERARILYENTPNDPKAAWRRAVQRACRLEYNAEGSALEKMEYAACMAGRGSLERAIRKQSPDL